MRKRISIIILIAIVLMMIVPTMNVYALNKQIVTLDASQENGVITVTGTAEAGTLAVAIAVYNENGTELITMKTTAVNDSNNFSDTINLEAGNYLIKVADYEGGDFAQKSISLTPNVDNNVGQSNNAEESKATEPAKTTKVEETKKEETNNSNSNNNNNAQTNNNQSNVTNTKKTPKTGDNIKILIIVLIVAVLSLGTFTIIKINKKRKSEKK